MEIVQELLTPGIVVAVSFFLWREMKGIWKEIKDLAVKVAKVEGLLESRPWERSAGGKNTWVDP